MDPGGSSRPLVTRSPRSHRFAALGFDHNFARFDHNFARSLARDERWASQNRRGALLLVDLLCQPLAAISLWSAVCRLGS